MDNERVEKEKTTETKQTDEKNEIAKKEKKKMKCIIIDIVFYT
jgi:hypothetical protein